MKRTRNTPEQAIGQLRKTETIPGRRQDPGLGTPAHGREQGDPRPNQFGGTKSEEGPGLRFELLLTPPAIKTTGASQTHRLPAPTGSSRDRRSSAAYLPVPTPSFAAHQAGVPMRVHRNIQRPHDAVASRGVEFPIVRRVASTNHTVSGKGIGS